MKISLDNKEFFSLSDTQKKVIQNDVQSEIFEEDVKRRLQYILMHKYEKCFERLKKEWESKLAKSGIKMIPTDPDAFAEMVFAQSSYRSRSQRDQEG